MKIAHAYKYKLVNIKFSRGHTLLIKIGTVNEL